MNIYLNDHCYHVETEEDLIAFCVFASAAKFAHRLLRWRHRMAA